MNNSTGDTADDTAAEVELRKAPTAPGTLLGIGILISLAGGVLLAVGDGAEVVGVAVVWAGSIVAGIGVIAMGVLIGMRYANYDEYLNRLIEDADS